MKVCCTFHHHYRSLCILPTVATYNNRAQAEINLKHWNNAMTDCERVLELEPGNTKGAFLLSEVLVLQYLEEELVF